MSLRTGAGGGGGVAWVGAAGCGFDFRWCHWKFSLTSSFRPHYGPGVDSASNRNEYQEYHLVVKGGRSLPPSCADCLEVWEPQIPGAHRACPGLYSDYFQSATKIVKCIVLSEFPDCMPFCKEGVIFSLFVIVLIFWVNSVASRHWPAPVSSEHNIEISRRFGEFLLDAQKLVLLGGSIKM